jgi:hypothetical protein
MINTNNSNPLAFYPSVIEFEKILGHITHPLDLIELISIDQFNDLRGRIIQVFQIGDVDSYTGEFGEEVEFGDVSDAVRDVTFSTYPQTTPMDKLITHDERREWCTNILAAMDYAAVNQF